MSIFGTNDENEIIKIFEQSQVYQEWISKRSEKIKGKILNGYKNADGYCTLLVIEESVLPNHYHCYRLYPLGNTAESIDLSKDKSNVTADKVFLWLAYYLKT